MSILKKLPMKIIIGIKTTFLFNLKGTIGLIKQWKNKFKSFKEKPLQNIISITIPLITTISIIMFIVSLIIFIINGGYTAHYNTGGDVTELFTDQATSIYYNSIIQIVLGVLIIISFVFACVSYFKEEKNGEYFKLLLTSLLLVYITVPILLFLASNIVRLVWTIAIIVIVYILLSFLSVMIIPSEGNDNNKDVKKVENSKSNLDLKRVKQGNVEFINVPKNMKIYRVKSFLPGDDYIEASDWMFFKRLCSVEEFEKGKVVITQNNCRVENIYYRKVSVK